MDDHQRFTEMYDACRQRVWAYVVSRAGRQVADEVVSEVFAIAWRRFADVPLAAGPVSALPWLIGVARNVLRDTIRAEVRRESMRNELRAWAEGDHAEVVAEKLAVIRALATLPEDDRELLILVAWQGLGPRDAAKVVGCSQAAFRVRLHRARKRLAQAVSAGADASGTPLPASVRIAS
ncbi:RNA polymerase sigma factor [Actinocorallia longicatena]|uniref:RNA polymerase sigma factor n=1 Tax=Actinocorallia longicatena TaxID=111803 RepID=UPI0031E038DA